MQPNPIVSHVVCRPRILNRQPDTTWPTIRSIWGTCNISGHLKSRTYLLCAIFMDLIVGAASAACLEARARFSCSIVVSALQLERWESPPLAEKVCRVRQLGHVRGGGNTSRTRGTSSQQAMSGAKLICHRPTPIACTSSVVSSSRARGGNGPWPWCILHNPTKPYYVLAQNCILLWLDPYMARSLNLLG
jgi:hypothetical protein